MIRTACILTPRTPRDGIRISTMSRHTLDDGKTPDTRIIAGISYDIHMPELAPPARLVGAWYRKKVDWANFTCQYLEHVRREPAATKLRELISRAGNETITLLCIEENPERCHRGILLETCLELAPGLEHELA